LRGARGRPVRSDHHADAPAAESRRAPGGHRVAGGAGQGVPEAEASAASLETPPVHAGTVVFAGAQEGPRPRSARPRRGARTKSMTAYLTLRRLPAGRTVTVSAEAAELGRERIGQSVLGVRDGERLTVRELLEALLLQSANDVAVALADAVAPSTDAFVSLMNRAARRLGLAHTVFYSPNGLDDRGHSTARAVAALTRAAERSHVF